ncbi:conserved protein of unknown function [Bradyrhizobium sp. ORS 285]|uniref:aminoacyl-tRNA deacylase n=1 Tax=Bradyrhizobium sp. ORS 285 TaxID=115808 RepID=UPI000240B155|nr:YbaK/EbsC family protein [Bradyrhizobium sp. ORS 285]CCD84773.1 conserved hypothetical protein [Bradyrhizobium sp. ORS 285]SMX56402.1 conserved protein of unknown function [Bradyrhizobium sp. ORS 285]
MNVHPKIEAALAEQRPIRVVAHASLAQPIRSPADFAKALGYPIVRIVKTVLLANAGVTSDQRSLSHAGQYAAVSVPSSSRINLARVSELMGWPRAELSSKGELQRLLDYPPGGVSPFGLGNIPLIFDESLLGFDSILVGAGVVGAELEVRPRALLDVAQGQVAQIVLT